MLDPENTGARDALAVAVVDGAQLLLDEPDLIPIGRGISSALKPDTGPALTSITLLRRGRDLENASYLVPAPKQTLIRLLQHLYTLDSSGVHPMSRLTDAIAEVNRDHQGNTLATGDFSGEDYRSVLNATGSFLIDQQRGLMRFINIVDSRCLPGATDPGCPTTSQSQ